ncbi:hypothetical protein [Deinococcus petrolearius]|uniref:Uncharacterized protein n=1 Tax=Deinococcus petrolearius TaxID=1751295 RepID=A0ABW1DDC9_9DEIO
MDVVRQGMQGAQVRFRTRPDEYSIMRPVSEVGPGWANHPDAALIAAAPQMADLIASQAATIAAQAAALAALQAQAQAFVDEFDGAAWWDGVPDEVSEARRALCAALAQASAGQEPGAGAGA